MHSTVQPCYVTMTCMHKDAMCQTRSMCALTPSLIAEAADMTRDAVNYHMLI